MDTTPNPAMAKDYDGSDGLVSSERALEFRRDGETLATFAQRLGVNVKTIRRWTTTNQRISLLIAEQVADALDIHPLLIWGNEYANAVAASDPTNILDEIDGLSASQAAERCGVTKAIVHRWRTTGTGTPASIEAARTNLARHTHAQRAAHGRKCHTTGEVDRE